MNCAALYTISQTKRAALQILKRDIFCLKGFNLQIWETLLPGKIEDSEDFAAWAGAFVQASFRDSTCWSQTDQAFVAIKNGIHVSQSRQWHISNLLSFLLCVCARGSNEPVVNNPRLGPSASSAHLGSADLGEIANALNLIQSLLGGSSFAKGLADEIAHKVSAAEEVAKAKLGESSASRLGEVPVAKSGAVPAALGKPCETPGETADAPAAPAEAEQPEVEPAPINPAAKEEVVNSATHRAAHARLTRRMQSASAVDFPNMHRMWSGSRKDGSPFFNS